jgi:hypothetical protein
MPASQITFTQVLPKRLGNETEAKKVIERWSLHNIR